MAPIWKWYNWLPWHFVVKKVARAHGFLDPINLLAQLQRFTQPTEVREPIELLRAGAVLHARGLINSRVIQHNLDWVWPYWVEQQFDPGNVSFIPRAFSITHINLTHRNWTALGLPNFANLPIVDPRGLLTPFIDQWSLDVWIKRKDGTFLLPSRAMHCTQKLHLNHGLSISTHSRMDNYDLHVMAHVESVDEKPVCVLEVRANTPEDATLVIALRPYNPEGVSFIHHVELDADHKIWSLDGGSTIQFDRAMDGQCLSDYRAGDVYGLLKHIAPAQGFEASHHCDIGMLTAAALFNLHPHEKNVLRMGIPLSETTDSSKSPHASVATTSELWRSHLAGAAQLQIPDSHMQFLYDAALRTLILHSVDKVVPGPYTYKRFWYRDATYIVYALLCVGLIERARQALEYFPQQQNAAGYFHSQEGEWDSNGQALWIFTKFHQFTGQHIPPSWQAAITKGAHWLIGKRLADQPELPHAGLLPAGFSAEHLGPIDFYYWDDYWAQAGLLAAQQLAQGQGATIQAEKLGVAAAAFAAAIAKSTAGVAQRLGGQLLPASPYRRMDAGAIGSIAAGYPLKLYAPDHPALMNTVNFLVDKCFVKGGFFQDMIHSGINPYLTLHLAQVLLRAGDRRFFDLMCNVAKSASPTGQWPEAIHPHTRGGCMGDGQHAWAAAEWLVMMRNCFVREEDERLILVSGIPKRWWVTGEPIALTAAPTEFGEISVQLQYLPAGIDQDRDGENPHLRRSRIVVSWQSEWHAQAPIIEVHLAGFEPIIATRGQTQVIILETSVESATPA